MQEGDGDDDRNNYHCYRKTLLYYYPIFQVEKSRPKEEKQFVRGHIGWQKQIQDLNQGFPILVHELSFSKEPTCKVIEERQVLLSPGDVSVCQ